MADINLTTTAIAATPTTIATLRALLRKELHDEDFANYRWIDSVLDRHLTRAVRELSLVAPLDTKTTLSTTAGSREVSIASIDGLVRIEAVEYPTGQWPPSYAPFSLFQSTLTLLTDAAPSTVQPLHVYAGKLHTLSASQSTLPATTEDVVICGASACAALEWASFATNRANVSGSAAFENYQTWGEERLRQFRESLRGFGREARLRNASLFRPAAVAGRDTVQWSS